MFEAYVLLSMAWALGLASGWLFGWVAARRRFGQFMSNRAALAEQMRRAAFAGREPT